MIFPRPSASPRLPIGELVDDSPAKRPTPVTLTGSRVKVCPLDPLAHGDDLYNSTHGEERDTLWQYLSEGPFSTRGDFDRYLHQNARSDDPLFFAIVACESSRAVGFASFLRVDPTNRAIEIGHVLFTPALQRTPAATEAMYLMAKHVFEDLGYRRYEWKCDALNAASCAAASRLGFSYEGTFRQHMIRKGRNRDTAWFSMLDREWPDMKAAFERWLDPVNFDSQGRQRQALSALRASP